jgi:RND family efflux transporter MFP subunit
LAGAHVKAGDLIARLTGAARDAAINRAEADVDRAQANLKLSHDLQDGLNQTPAGLVTASQRQSADNGLKTSTIDLDAARSAMELLVAAGEIRAPLDGTITAVLTSEGQQVAPDAPVVRLQAATAMWLEASYWGEDAANLAIGMRGRFTPADGSAPVDVKLARIVSPVRADGSTVVACEAQPAGQDAASRPSFTSLRMGQAGTLVLLEESQSVIEVPTSALIMSAGQWWVVVRTHDGEKPQQVEPGVEDGLQTIIRRGIAAGDSIVVSDAYLHFHRDFARQYQQPD